MGQSAISLLCILTILAARTRSSFCLDGIIYGWSSGDTRLFFGFLLEVKATSRHRDLEDFRGPSREIKSRPTHVESSPEMEVCNTGFPFQSSWAVGKITDLDGGARKLIEQKSMTP